MSMEGLEQLPADPESNPFIFAIEQLDHSEMELFDSATQLSQTPTAKCLQILNEKSQEAVNAFQDAIDTIMESDEFPVPEMADQMSTLLLNKDAIRVAWFQPLAPAASFKEADISRERLSVILVSDLQEASENEQQQKMISKKITDYYASSLLVDTQKLVNEVQPISHEQALSKNEQVGSRLIDVGLVSAGIIIGSLITRGVMKGFQNGKAGS